MQNQISGIGKWYRKISSIPSPINFKKTLPEGTWKRCPECKNVISENEKEGLYYVCHCGYHFRIGSKEYFEILFDNQDYSLKFDNIVSKDILEFQDTETYCDRLTSALQKTGLTDAICIGEGSVNNRKILVGAMDFTFIGGSMGTVVGERISRAVDHSVKHNLPLLLITKSGGARIMESSFSLMQMAKIVAKIRLLEQHKIPFITLLTDPTIGGVTASFAMLGDIIMAEPGALIGYTPPRVIKETIGKELPNGFQKAEFLLENGFLDMIVHRKEFKEKITSILSHF